MIHMLFICLLIDDLNPSLASFGLQWSCRTAGELESAANGTI